MGLCAEGALRALAGESGERPRGNDHWYRNKSLAGLGGQPSRACLLMRNEENSQRSPLEKKIVD